MRTLHTSLVGHYLDFKWESGGVGLVGYKPGPDLTSLTFDGFVDLCPYFSPCPSDCSLGGKPWHHLLP